MALDVCAVASFSSMYSHTESLQLFSSLYFVMLVARSRIFSCCLPETLSKGKKKNLNLANCHVFFQCCIWLYCGACNNMSSFYPSIISTKVLKEAFWEFLRANTAVNTNVYRDKLFLVCSLLLKEKHISRQTRKLPVIGDGW